MVKRIPYNKPVIQRDAVKHGCGGWCESKDSTGQNPFKRTNDFFMQTSVSLSAEKTLLGVVCDDE